jgi:hypothetical protein
MRFARTALAAPIVAAVALAGCSGDKPPAYRLNGDACLVVPADYFQSVTGATPTKTPSQLKDGMQGGACELDFDGSGGFLKQSVFIAIRSDEAAAKSMFDQFKTSDQEDAQTPAIGDKATVTDVKDLGDAAYVEYQHDNTAPWSPDQSFLYKLGVRHGTLVLTIVASGAAPTGQPGSWPTTEDALRGKVQDVVRGVMKNLTP